MTSFRESRDKGAAYLLARQGADGAFPAEQPSVDGYYKTLSALQVCGRNDAANRLCDWIRANGMTPEGDFGPRPDGIPGSAYVYLNAWVIIGAHRLGQFDLSNRGMEYVLGFRDTESGGFYSHATERNAETPQDVMMTSMCGLAALYTGHHEAARGVGNWLRTVRDAQPDFPRKLYTVYNRAQGLLTDPPPEEIDRYLLIRDATYDQHIFNPGIAAAFLCRLYQAGGEREWLELAKDYLRVAEDASDFLYRIVRAGKVGWASSLLYRVTGETKYLEMAGRVGKNLIDLQSAHGFWSGVGQTTPSDDSTAERVVWMDEINQAVSSGQ